MLQVSVIPKWAWFVGAAALLGGVYFTGKYAIAVWDAKTEEVSDLKASNANLLQINNDINAELIKQINDRKEVEAINLQLEADKGNVSVAVGDLSKQLDAEIALRKEAERKHPETVCYDPVPGPPPEVKLTWKAYCKASSDPTCSKTE